MLRRAAASDLDALDQLETECFQERKFRRDHLDWILRNPKALTLLADEGRQLAGAVMLLFEGRVCRVLSVAVAPGSRRKGLGSAMMHAAEEEARARGCELVRLEVSTRNVAAIEMYRRLGYRTDGVLYGYYSWGEDAYSMTKPLREDRVARQEADPATARK